MPIYEYACRACGKQFERYLKVGDEAVTCTACQSPNVDKRLSTFAVSTTAGPKTGGEPVGPCGSACSGGSCQFN